MEPAAEWKVFFVPGEPGASVAPPDTDYTGPLEPVPVAAPQQLSPPSQGVNNDGNNKQPSAQLPTIDHTCHLPLATEEKHHQPGETPNIVSLNAHTVVSDSDQAMLKSNHFSNDVYIVTAAGITLHIAVFMTLAFAGSPTYAGIYALSFLLEILIASIVYNRHRALGRMLLKLGCLLTWTFFGVTLAFAISSCITNWVHFEVQVARWIAIGLSFAHTLLIGYMGVCLVNILQCKHIIAIRAIQTKQAEFLRSGPQNPSASNGSKMKET